MRLDEWIRTHADDPRAQTPHAIEMVNRRRTWLADHGNNTAESILARANEDNVNNTHALRDVVVGIAALNDRIETDPSLSAADASKASDVLIHEYNRLRSLLPRMAQNVDHARAIKADPISVGEEFIEKWPQVVNGRIPQTVPSLPPF